MVRQEASLRRAHIGPVERPAAYERVVEQIRRAIHLGAYGPGDKLPAERALADELRVSRVTVREALRVLEGEGYLKSRRGAAGGPFILEQAREPSSVTLASLRSRLREFDDILDFREATESVAARLAATKRRKGHLKAMAADLEAMETSESLTRFRGADSAFHLTIAEAADNPMLLSAIEDARAGMFLPIDTLNFKLLLANSVRGHRRILAAIEAGDGARAARSMKVHIETTRKELRHILGIGEEER
jgi:GntR family transcriptional repressor for pyruvate dehydrogenase complex